MTETGRKLRIRQLKSIKMKAKSSKIIKVIILVSIPFICVTFRGYMKYNEAMNECKKLAECSDQNIVNVLRSYNFDLDIFDNPNIYDYFLSGIK